MKIYETRKPTNYKFKKGGTIYGQFFDGCLGKSRNAGIKSRYIRKNKKRISFDWVSDFLDIAGFLEYLKVIPEEAVRVDTAMTQLSRSTGASASALQAYFEQAADSAQNTASPSVT